MQAVTNLAREAFLASQAIYPGVRKTELHRSAWLSVHGDVQLKLENLQVGTDCIRASVRIWNQNVSERHLLCGTGDRIIQGKGSHKQGEDRLRR